jgi:hypothetical protein
MADFSSILIELSNKRRRDVEGNSEHRRTRKGGPG